MATTGIKLVWATATALATTATMESELVFSMATAIAKTTTDGSLPPNYSRMGVGFVFKKDFVLETSKKEWQITQVTKTAVNCFVPSTIYLPASFEWCYVKQKLSQTLF